jgi:phage terminase large subunit-like protein
MCRIIDSTKTICLRDEPNSFYKAISADADIQDGVEPHCVVFDELHRQRHRDLWDVLKYGMAIRRQPLMFAITTAGVTGHSPICEELHDYARRIIDGVWSDPTFYPVIYGLSETDDWTMEGSPGNGKRAPTGWYKANPALGDFLPVDRVRDEARKAMELPNEQNSFRRLRLNQWVAQETRFIPMDLWRACAGAIDLAALAGKTCYGGLDLSTTRDFTAFVLVFPLDGKFIWVPHLFLPEDDLYERSRKDNVPYDLWAKQGFIHLTPGNQVDYATIRKAIKDASEAYDLREVSYDAWNATQIVQQLIDDGITMVPMRQGFASMNAPTGELLSQVKTGSLRHGNNPALNWMADCMTVKQDPAGNVKPVKPERNKSTKRIDGIVAGINATARLIVSESYSSIYDNAEPVWVEEL